MHTSTEEEEEAVARLERRWLILRGRLDSPPPQELLRTLGLLCTLDKGDTDTLGLNAVKNVEHRLKNLSFNNVHLLFS